VILAIVVLGGMGSQIGVAIAAADDRSGSSCSGTSTKFRMLLFGLAMVMIMIWKPARADRPPQRPRSRWASARDDRPRASPRATGGGGCRSWKVRELTMRFGGIVAVDSLDHSRQRHGEVTAIIGPNGAGKTTAVQLHHRASTSRARVRSRCACTTDGAPGRPALAGRPSHRHEARIARTFQNIRLFPA
jgi:hypothetical protein